MMGEKLSSTARKLLSGSVLRLANLVAAGASSFLLMPFIVHHLGDRLYGFWTLAAAFIGYYGVLDFGITSAVSQYICVAIGRNDQSECRTVFNTAFRIQSLIGGVALLVTAAIAAAAPWFCHNPTDAALFRKVIIILGVNMAIGFPVRTFAGVLEAQLRFDVQSGLGIFGLALRSGLMVWAILKGGGLLALAWMVLFATVPVIILQDLVCAAGGPMGSNRSFARRVENSQTPFFLQHLYLSGDDRGHVPVSTRSCCHREFHWVGGRHTLQSCQRIYILLR